MARFAFRFVRIALAGCAVWAVAWLDAEAATAGAGVARSSQSAPSPTLTPMSDVVERRFEGFDLPPRVRDTIVAAAMAQVGARYRFGGTSPTRGFDCSGLVRYVLNQVNVRLPRTAYLQARVGVPVDPAQLLPGDIVAFGPDSVSHIGIFVGDGRFVHASSVAGRVIVSPLDRPPHRLIKPLQGARRLLAIGELAPGAAGQTMAARR